MNASNTTVFPNSGPTITTQPSVVRALARVVDPAMGQQLTEVHENKLQAIRQEAERLAAFMKEIADRD